MEQDQLTDLELIQLHAFATESMCFEMARFLNIEFKASDLTEKVISNYKKTLSIVEAAIVLNGDPRYEAGIVLGLSTKEVDALPEKLHQDFNDIYRFSSGPSIINFMRSATSRDDAIFRELSKIEPKPLGSFELVPV